MDELNIYTGGGYPKREKKLNKQTKLSRKEKRIHRLKEKIKLLQNELYKLEENDK